jgi:hypothetical protein
MLLSAQRELAILGGNPKKANITQCSPAATQKRVILASLILESEQLMGEVIADEDKIDDSRNDSFSPWIQIRFLIQIHSR